MAFQQEAMEAILTPRTGKSAGRRQHPSRDLEIWQIRSKKINGNYLSEDMKYKTVTEILDPVLDNSSSKERKSKNLQELQNHQSYQSFKQSRATGTFESSRNLSREQAGF